MSWLFSRALVAEYSVAACLDGRLSARLSMTPMPPLCSWRDKTMARSIHFRSGMTHEVLTEPRGAALLMWCLEASRAKRTAAHLEDDRWRMTSGRKCDGSWQMSLPGTYLPRTSQGAQLTLRRTTSSRWVTPSDAVRCQRQTWVQTTFGSGTGYLHTPTTMANFCAPSMQKHPSCREWVKVFGQVSPGAFEWLMGWTAGWTDLRQLETDKCQSAPSRHGKSLQEAEA